MATNAHSFQKNNFNIKTNSLFHIRRKFESKTVYFTIIFGQNNNSNKLFSCQTQMDIKTNKTKLFWVDKLVTKTHKLNFITIKTSKALSNIFDGIEELLLCVPRRNNWQTRSSNRKIRKNCNKKIEQISNFSKVSYHKL